jgi:SAM-dependent methyltransferase
LSAVNDTRICPLCRNKSYPLYEGSGKIYFSCAVCGGIFVPQEFHLPIEKEKKRYMEHNNDVRDPSYRKFVSPVVDFVLRHFSAGKHEGLDFGSGTGPVITAMLEEKGYKISLYDPFFHPKRENLLRKYDFIIASEVIEHFKNPAYEFRLLADILKNPGALVCMTDVYDPRGVFAEWYYKNDPTHIFFYSKKTMEYIRNAYGFRFIIRGGRLTVFTACPDARRGKKGAHPPVESF